MTLTPSKIASLRDLICDFIEELEGPEDLSVLMARLIVRIEETVTEEERSDGERVH